MSIDYDKIQQGRRREWKELLSPEERARRRKEEEAKVPPDQQKPKSWLRQRDDQMEAQRERDKAQWAAAKRKVQRMLIAGVVIIGALMIGSMAWMSVARQRMTDKFVKLEPLITRGQTFQAFGDPVDAWASWRSALIRRDGKALGRIESPKRQERNRGQRDPAAYIAQLDDMLKRGRLASDIHIAKSFSDPIIITMPDSPWGDGELAVMLSKPLDPAPTADSQRAPRGRQPVRRAPSKSVRWVAVFSYHRKAGEWRFEDLRAEKNWDTSWTYAGHIRPVIEMERKAQTKRANQQSTAP